MNTDFDSRIKSLERHKQKSINDIEDIKKKTDNVPLYTEQMLIEILQENRKLAERVRYLEIRLGISMFH